MVLAEKLLAVITSSVTFNSFWCMRDVVVADVNSRRIAILNVKYVQKQTNVESSAQTLTTRINDQSLKTMESFTSEW